MTALVANPILDDVAKSPQVYSFIRRISDNFPSRHFKSIFNSTRHPQANIPCLVTRNNNYSLEDNSQPSFSHANSSADTHIFHRLNVEPLSYLQEEHELLKRCYQSLPDLSFNSEYKKYFQSIAGQELISTQGRGAYITFLNEFKKILAKNYGKRIEFTDREIDSQLDPENLMDSENDLIEFDLVNNSAVQLIYTLQNIVDNITDEETNYFCLTSHSFVHPIISLLSPAALAISFFNSKLLKLVKPRTTDNQFYYSKQSLPRVSYINFTGIYSEIDIDTLHGFSESVQTITIYDERTGGPSSILTPGLHKEQDFRTHRQAFTAISDLLLLIPLRCDLEKGGKAYRPNDIFEIFETLVLRSISKFKPSYIVLNCSLTFGDDNQTPFAMDQETFARIVSILNQLSNCKVVVYPFKLPNARNPEVNQMLERSKMYLHSQAQKMRYQGIIDRFAVPYDDQYFHSCFVNMIESLANLKKDKIRNKYSPSPLKCEMLYKLGKFYKNHNYYNFIHTKSYGVFAQIVKDNIQPVTYSDTTPYNLDNKLPLIYSDSSIGMAALGYQEGDKNEIILDANTQYFVDYERFTEPTIYIFNAKAKASSLNNLLQTVTPLSHFVISFDKDPVFNSQFEPLLFDQFEIEGLESIPQVKDFGMSKCESFVFQVYGTYIERKLDTTDICYFDFGSKKHYKIQITNSHGEILPRHSVTSCAFKKKDTYYLYIFGGRVHPNTKYNNKSLGTLDIIDIVEVYTTKDPTSSQWEYQILAKDKLFANKQDGFIPFRQSYAYYSHEDDKIFLMGGTILPNSVLDWTFPVFEFDVEANQFTAFTTFLNERKDNMLIEPSRKLGDSRPVAAVAIADRNKNFWYDQKNKRFLFLLPSRDYRNPFTLYSYHHVSKTCNFETAKIEKIQEKEKDNRAPVLPVKDVKTLLSVKETIEIGYKFSSNLEKKILLEFVQWRIQLEEPTIELTMLQNRIDNAQEALKTELSKLNEESNDKLKLKEINEKQNKIEAYENLRSLIQGKMTQNTFINLDNKLLVLERFLKSRISEYNPEKKSDEVDFSLSNYEIKDYRFLKPKNSEANPEKELPVQSDVSFIESGEVDISLSSYKIKGYQSFDKDRNTVFLKNPNGDVSVLASDPKIIEDKFKQNRAQKVLTDLSDNNKFDKIEEKVSELSLSSKDMAELSSGYIQVLKNDNTLAPRMDESFVVLDTSHANVVEFKNCISVPSSYQAFLSTLKNALSIITTDKKGQVQQKTLRFKVVSEEVELEEISFYLSPSSITFYNGVIICYIDQEFKRSHPHLYDEYKNWVLYANVEQIVSSMQLGGTHPKHLVFKKLFALTADESIFNRCLLLNQESLFLFGGKSIRYKGKKSAIYHNLVSKYDLFKLKEVTLQTSFMRDNDTEEMQNNCGECVAVSTGKYIFVCQKENAKEIDIYKANGTHEESIQFDFSTKGWDIHLNLVNIREREEILITLYTQDKDMKFVLLDVKKKTFEEKVVLVPKNTEENIPSPVLYSGYEVLSHNINTQPIKEIQMCHIRGDKPQVVVYDIQVGS